ncbi:ferredoxin reductase-like protein [Macrolepiota fuliginosa MF-IS2]|uniref:Ferredoxin reductase-like protein n=1 Tax=Macrolepiota fuliginosa MF-IS2 TaxID=1400762 RepID=A0A9P5XJV0_9AGAR|nr:ferredoxin reductase-like protein [Macrolepiota fuliginosa MF-IS2]
MLRISAQNQIGRYLHRHILLAPRCFSRRFLTTEQSEPKSRKWALPLAGGLFIGLASLYFFLPDVSRSAPTTSRKPLSARHFTPTTVISSESSGPDTKILKLRVPPNLVPKEGDDPIGFGPIWSVFIKDDDIQVERPYTPLESIDEDGTMVFWIKKYPRGEVGRWLHSKQPGDTIELRGPLKTWPWKEGEWDEVVMISGGTGITPFYQLVHQVFEHPTSISQNTRFTLVHGSRTPEELPPERVLGPLAAYAEEHPHKFRLKLFVDADDGSKPPLVTPSLETCRVNDEHMKRIMGVPELTWWQRWFSSRDTRPAISQKTLFLVCGPEPMIAAIAGPYGRNYSQGPTLGILGRLGVTPKQVWKL